MGSTQRVQNLADPHEALDAYFDTLLSDESYSEVEAEHETPDVVAATLQLSSAGEIAESGDQHIGETVAAKETSCAPQQVASDESGADALSSPGVAEPRLAYSPEAIAGTEPIPAAAVFTPAARPAQPIQTMIFSVGKLNLAIPIKDIIGIMKWPANISRPPGMPEWKIGSCEERGERVTIVDTAKLVIPQNRRDLMPEQNDYQHVIIVGKSKWGIACNDVSKVINLDPAQVKWSDERNIRPWLAGTVITQMCALLNSDAFIALLEQSAESARV
ncbi:MAG: hypothetical protein A2V90_07825 [Gammaproteobacteria bacterium RBG_16_57_12]|nr:MAG: hypothetical protein A2V90_07825 [Gammaproteobacteria bacterium RBG_16_57_12]